MSSNGQDRLTNQRKFWRISLVKIVSALHVSSIFTENVVYAVLLFGKTSFDMRTDELVCCSDESLQAGVRRGCRLSYSLQPTGNEGKPYN